MERKLHSISVNILQPTTPATTKETPMKHYIKQQPNQTILPN